MNTEQQIQDRIEEIDRELKETLELKRSNKLSNEDVEDVSDNYQMHIEWNYYIQELNCERSELIKQRNTFHNVEDLD